VLYMPLERNLSRGFCKFLIFEIVRMNELQHPVAKQKRVLPAGGPDNRADSTLEGGPSKLRLGGGFRQSPALHQRTINPLVEFGSDSSTNSASCNSCPLQVGIFPTVRMRSAEKNPTLGSKNE
jgi:hypothetical protein